MSSSVEELLSGIRLIPVVTINSVQHAEPLAEALLSAGIGTIEVTLRTDAALNAIEAIAKHVPEIILGVGSVTKPQQTSSAADAGAQYAVSPGHTNELLTNNALPFLPGASTASEVMSLRERGYFYQTFFPAEPSGGLAMLKAIHAPIPDVKFCPTGGINASNASIYISEPFISAVGGSWFIDTNAVERGDFTTVTSHARTLDSQCSYTLIRLHTVKIYQILIG